MKTDADAVRETINKWGGLDGMILSAGLVEPLGERQDSTRQLSGREILKIADLPLDQAPAYVQANLLSILTSSIRHSPIFDGNQAERPQAHGRRVRRGQRRWYSLWPVRDGQGGGKSAL